MAAETGALLDFTVPDTGQVCLFETNHLACEECYKSLLGLLQQLPISYTSGRLLLWANTYTAPAKHSSCHWLTPVWYILDTEATWRLTCLHTCTCQGQTAAGAVLAGAAAEHHLQQYTPLLLCRVHAEVGAVSICTGPRQQLVT